MAELPISGKGDSSLDIGNFPTAGNIEGAAKARYEKVTGLSTDKIEISEKEAPSPSRPVNAANLTSLHRMPKKQTKRM